MALFNESQSSRLEKMLETSKRDPRLKSLLCDFGRYISTIYKPFKHTKEGKVYYKLTDPLKFLSAVIEADDFAALAENDTLQLSVKTPSGIKIVSFADYTIKSTELTDIIKAIQSTAESVIQAAEAMEKDPDCIWQVIDTEFYPAIEYYSVNKNLIF